MLQLRGSRVLRQIELERARVAAANTERVSLFVAAENERTKKPFATHQQGSRVTSPPTASVMRFSSRLKPPTGGRLKPVSQNSTAPRSASLELPTCSQNHLTTAESSLRPYQPILGVF